MAPLEQQESGNTALEFEGVPDAYHDQLTAAVITNPEFSEARKKVSPEQLHRVIANVAGAIWEAVGHGERKKLANPGQFVAEFSGEQRAAVVSALRSLSPVLAGILRTKGLTDTAEVKAASAPTDPEVPALGREFTREELMERALLEEMSDSSEESENPEGIDEDDASGSEPEGEHPAPTEQPQGPSNSDLAGDLLRKMQLRPRN